MENSYAEGTDWGMMAHCLRSDGQERLPMSGPTGKKLDLLSSLPYLVAELHKMIFS